MKLKIQQCENTPLQVKVSKVKTGQTFTEGNNFLDVKIDSYISKR